MFRRPILLLAALALGPLAGAQSRHVWPISATAEPDLPLSSTFGPRLKASENYRYDFHRGIDIPVPWGTPVHAIADGQVRLAGDYSFYTDTLVQLRHRRPGTKRHRYYSNYMHLSSVAVREGQWVARGQVIGYSGASESGFNHLHFEIRAGGIYQKYCIHPLAVLPYADRVGPHIAIDAVRRGGSGKLSVDVSLTLPAGEPDLNRVEVLVRSRSGKLVDRHAYDMTRWNRRYTPKTNANRYLDDPDFNGVTVKPAKFNARSPVYRLGLTFYDLEATEPLDALAVTARAVDVRGNVARARFRR